MFRRLKNLSQHISIGTLYSIIHVLLYSVPVKHLKMCQEMPNEYKPHKKKCQKKSGLVKFTSGLERLTAWGYLYYIELFLITGKHTQSIDQGPILRYPNKKRQL